MVNRMQNFVAPATKFCTQRFMAPVRYHLLGLEASHESPRSEGGDPRRPDLSSSSIVLDFFIPIFEDEDERN
jgi:hypothetical protein